MCKIWNINYLVKKLINLSCSCSNVMRVLRSYCPQIEKGEDYFEFLSCGEGGCGKTTKILLSCPSPLSPRNIKKSAIFKHSIPSVENNYPMAEQHCPFQILANNVQKGLRNRKVLSKHSRTTTTSAKNWQMVVFHKDVSKVCWYASVLAHSHGI